MSGDEGAVNLAAKLAQIGEPWTPHIIGELNGQHVKLARLQGEFVWHYHEDADELFLVVRGRMTMRLRDRDVVVDEGNLFIVPRGVEHLPVGEPQAEVLVFEPAGTLNTGNVRNERTVDQPERI